MDELVVLDGVVATEPKTRRKGNRKPRDRFSPAEVAQVEALWASGASRTQVAAILRVSVGVFAEHTTFGQFMHLPRRQGQGGGRPRGFRLGADDSVRGYRDPSPAEIEVRAAAIRATWSAEDAQLRANRIDPTGAMSMQAAMRSSGVRIYRTSDFQLQ